MHYCDLMDYYLNKCEDKIVYNSLNYDEYGIAIPGDTSSYIIIKYCPWCGEKLPKSKRDLWVDMIYELGYDDIFDEDIPEVLKTEEWYKSLPNVDDMTAQEVIEALGLKPKKNEDHSEK